MRRQKFDGIIISHLGNLNGRQPEKENTLPYLQTALKLGWHICVDVTFQYGTFLLPALNNKYAPVPPAFFSNQRVWCRASDAITLDALCNINAHTFPVAMADVVLTSAQFLWTLPPTILTPRSIAVFPEFADSDWMAENEHAGICTNHPEVYI